MQISMVTAYSQFSSIFTIYLTSRYRIWSKEPPAPDTKIGSTQDWVNARLGLCNKLKFFERRGMVPA